MKNKVRVESITTSESLMKMRNLIPGTGNVIEVQMLLQGAE